MKTLKKLNSRQRRELVDAAAGRIPVDLLIVNVNIVNVFTYETYPGVIGLKHGYIAYALPEKSVTSDPVPECGGKTQRTYDGKGSYAVPGFIDSHVHIESSMMTPRRFAELVVPHGTTAIVTDPHEIANVLGEEGILYMLEAAEGLPMYQLALAPSCVPSVPGLEESGAEFGPEEISRLLDHDRIIGIAEVMDYLGTVANNDRMRAILDLGFERECFMQGHYFGDGEHEMAAYLCAGPTSNHEIFTRDAAVAAARAGMVIDARDSSFSRDVETIVKAVKDYGRMSNFTICTDDREPAEIVHKGHINDCVRHAIEAGMEPIAAIRAASFNTAQLYGLARLGAIAPGYIGNIGLTKDLLNLAMEAVFFEGEPVAEGRELLVPIETRSYALERKNSVVIQPLKADDLRLRVPAGSGERVRVRVIEYPDRLSLETICTEMDLPVRDGFISLNGSVDLNFIAVVNRHAGKQGLTVGIVRNFHLERGALAGTVSHDAHNLTLVYHDPEEVLAAVALVQASGGGVAYVDGAFIRQVELPVAGLMSSGDPQQCIAAVDELNRVLATVGIETANPVMRLATAALPVIPYMKITDKGLVDVLSGSFLDVFV